MDLDRLRKVFLEGFEARAELGASVSVWKDGQELMTLSQGVTCREQRFPWTDSTIAPVFSATKGPSAATFLLALDAVGMSLETAVRRVWSRFPIEGVNFGELISHQCGLSAIDTRIHAEQHDEIIVALEQQSPSWAPGTAHGYHPRLVGYMQDEIIRRLHGVSLGEYWQAQIAAPLNLDFWIGLPESEDHRVATLYPGKMDADQMRTGFYAQIGTTGTLVNRSFKSPYGVQGANDMNKTANQRIGYPAMGGVGSARALAKFYQASLGYLDSNPFPASIRSLFSQRLTNGDDLVLQTPTAFSSGFMMDPLNAAGENARCIMGNGTTGYGHPGAGGSHAFADPSTGYSFAYVMNQMEVTVLPGKRVHDMLGI